MHQTAVLLSIPKHIISADNSLLQLQMLHPALPARQTSGMLGAGVQVGSATRSFKHGLSRLERSAVVLRSGTIAMLSLKLHCLANTSASAHGLHVGPTI